MKIRNTRKQERFAFTLIELLVVIAIIAVLIGLLLPGIMSARRAASRAQEQVQMRNIALGIVNYAGTNRRPPAAWVSGSQQSWATRILPYVEEEDLYKAVNADPAGPVGAASLGSTVLPLYLSPGDPTITTTRQAGSASQAQCSFVANLQVLGATPGGAFPGSMEAPKNTLENVMADGSSKTIILSTRFAITGDPTGTPLWGHSWSGMLSTAVAMEAIPVFAIGNPDGSSGAPDTGPSVKFQTVAPTAAGPGMPTSIYPTGIHVAMGDGSVKWVGQDVDAAVWWAMVTPAQGEIYTAPW